jgi:FkbM family methyltransferase
MKRIAERRRQGHPQLAVFAQDLIGQAINVYGWWELEQLTVLRQFVLTTRGRGGSMLDIGANIGNHSVYLRDLFDEVHAVEANPCTFSLLKFNLAPYRHMTAQAFAASDKASTLCFQVESMNVGASHVMDIGQSASNAATIIEVQGCAIGDVIRTEHPVSLVKIDVEGHELQAIRGMARMLIKDAPCVVFEQQAGDFRGGTSAVIEALRGLGYASFFSVERVPSSRAGGLLAQVWSNLKAVCGGFRMKAVELHKFEPGFYEMIIAVHPDVEQAAADAR